MTNSYAIFTQVETKNQDCPILLDSVSIKDTDHPKKTILLKTGKKYYCFDTKTLWKWITYNKKTHPITNLPLDQSDIDRIEFYKETLDKFPEMTLSQSKQLVVESLNTFFQTGKISNQSIIEHFADIEDFKPYMFDLPPNQSFRKNANRVILLFEDPKYWILRKTSLIGSPGEYEYYGISTNQGHFAIKHSFGQGYWSISGSNNQCEFMAPSFMKCLNINNISPQDLVCGSIDNGKIQLRICDAPERS